MSKPTITIPGLDERAWSRWVQEQSGMVKRQAEKYAPVGTMALRKTTDGQLWMWCKEELGWQPISRADKAGDAVPSNDSNS